MPVLRSTQEALGDPTRIPDPSIEKRARFPQALGSLVDAFGWFDYNLGLKLLHYLPREQSSELLKADTPFKRRLDALRDLMDKAATKARPKHQPRWADWKVKAESLRVVRNAYAHGRWEFPEYGSRDDPNLRFIPLNWDNERPPGAEITSVSIDEIEAHAKLAWELMKEMAELVRIFLDDYRA